MTLRRLPRAYAPLALLTTFGMLPAMLIDGDHIRPSAAGLAFVIFFLVLLARGSVVAWVLILVWNVFLVLSVTASSGTWLAGAPLLLINAMLCLALLLTPSMRDHVRLRRGRAIAVH
jgi:hypothetical protein